MKKHLLFFLSLLFFNPYINAQDYGGAVPELTVAYYGEYIFHPGAKVGISLPFSEWTKLKKQETKRRGEYDIVKQKELRLGGGLSFYHIVRNHNGYLASVELAYRRSKFYSYRPEKKGLFEFGIGLGYFRYSLHGTTFQPDGNSFKEINGNGGAFMPSFFSSYGGHFRWKGKRKARYFFKGNLLAEIPFGTALQVITVLEAGIAVPIDINLFQVKQGETKVKALRKNRKKN